MSLLDNEEHNNVIVILRVSGPCSLINDQLCLCVYIIHCAMCVSVYIYYIHCVMSLCNYNSKQPIKEWQILQWRLVTNLSTRNRFFCGDCCAL